MSRCLVGARPIIQPENVKDRHPITPQRHPRHPYLLGSSLHRHKRGDAAGTSACAPQPDDSHHSHRPTKMTTTYINNDHGDEGDNDDLTKISTSSSEILGTQKSELAPKFHMVAEQAQSPLLLSMTRSNDYHPSSPTSTSLRTSTSQHSGITLQKASHSRLQLHQFDPHDLPDHLWTSPSTLRSTTLSTRLQHRQEIAYQDATHHVFLR